MTEKYIEIENYGTIILEAIVGSKAYGLEIEESDEDKLGIYVADTEDVLRLHKLKETIDHVNPDYCYHEIEKYLRLAIQCNPTILELMFMDEYTIETKWGKALINTRDAFLSNTIFNSYGGYAVQQARKLNARGDSFSSKVKNRYDKHARHCFRLLQQGKQLLETGTLDVKVKNREELFAIGRLPVQELVSKFEEEFKKFKEIKSILPDKPNYDVIEDYLWFIRREFYVVQ